ncbi:FHA domain-containing protein [Candidatus Sumerlaeota bacterium]|nr:FHA domain-containing protein [Candidatus Sumerlaeota bacterium]
MPLIPDQLPGTGVLRLHGHVEGLEDYFVLARPVSMIGRHPNNHLCLPRKTVSRFHARIERDGSTYFLEDLGSSNGTLVNAVPVRRLPIKNEDVVSFGDVEFTFFLDEETTSKHFKEGETQIRFDRGDATPVTQGMRKQDVTDAGRTLADIEEIGSLTQAARHLRVHYRFLDIIRQRPSEERLLNSFLELMFEASVASRGVIMLHGEGESRLAPAAVRFREERYRTDELLINETMTKTCLEERVAVLAGDPDTASQASPQELTGGITPVRSAVCVPLLTRQRVLGVCYLDIVEGNAVFDDSELRFVASLAAQLALALDNLRMTRERLQAEQMVIIGQTMAEISHSIKNILLVTHGGAQLLDKALADGNVETAATTWKVVRHSISRVNSLVKDMLNYSRAEDRKRQEVLVNNVVSEVFDAVRPETDQLGVRLSMELHDDIPPCWIDPNGLYEAVTNLVVNSREAIPEKSKGWILIRTEEIPGDRVCVSVADNGKGISRDLIERVFLPFFTTKGAQGNGMGLAMVKKFAREMGGDIEIESDEGHGTTVRLLFPVSTLGEEDA